MTNMGQKLFKMRIAASRSLTDFRTWQFIFANILFHEIAHLFVTFLGNNSTAARTPPHINCGLPGYSDGIIRGEAGRWLEYALFGGPFELYPDPHRHDDQQVRMAPRWEIPAKPGPQAEMPHILSAGNGCVIARKISRHAINRTLNYRKY